MLIRLSVAFLALFLLISLPSFAELYTEWLWFGETGFQPLFLKSLATKILLGVSVFIAAFGFLFANLRMRPLNKL